MTSLTKVLIDVDFVKITGRWWSYKGVLVDNNL